MANKIPRAARSCRLFDKWDYMTRRIVLLLITILLASGCTTTPPTSSGIWIAGMSESVTRYYIPATTWSEKNGSAKCRLDITYVNEPDRQVICNISFFIRNGAPKEEISLSFSGDSSIFPLNDARIMFTRVEQNEFRITSVIEIEELLLLFKSEVIYLKAVIDSFEYTFIPNEEFMRFRNQFLEQIVIPMVVLSTANLVSI